ncbi:hypothetical protein VPH35_037760 [Triticum aestivum]
MTPLHSDQPTSSPTPSPRHQPQEPRKTPSKPRSRAELALPLKAVNQPQLLPHSKGPRSGLLSPTHQHGRASRRSRHPPRRRFIRPLAGRPPRRAIQLCLLPLLILVLPGSPPRQPPRRVLSALPEGQVGGEGAIGEVHGSGVGRGTTEGRARGHQGAAQHNPLPPHPGSFGVA